MFLSGEVVLDDGQITEEQVRVELVCRGGRVLGQDYTSGDGTFSIDIKSNTQDDSLDLSLCELQAQTPGYEPAKISVGLVIIATRPISSRQLDDIRESLIYACVVPAFPFEMRKIDVVKIMPQRQGAAKTAHQSRNPLPSIIGMHPTAAAIMNTARNLRKLIVAHFKSSKM